MLTCMGWRMAALADMRIGIVLIWICLTRASSLCSPPIDKSAFSMDDLIIRDFHCIDSSAMMT